MAQHNIAVANLEEQAKQTSSQYYIFLTFISFLIITLLSIKDKELLISDRQISLPILNIGIPPDLLFIFGPLILIIFYINFHIHLYRFIQVASSILINDQKGNFFPFIIFQSIFHRCNGAVGKLESSVTKITVFGLLVPTLSIFCYWGIKKHQWQLDIYLLLVLMFGMLLERFWIWASFLQHTQKIVSQPYQAELLVIYHLIVVLLTALCLFFFIPISLRQQILISHIIDNRIALCGLFFLFLHVAGNLTRLSNIFNGTINNLILSLTTRTTAMAIILSGFFSSFIHFDSYNPNAGESSSEPFKFLLLDVSYQTLSKKPELWENPFEKMETLENAQIITNKEVKEYNKFSNLYFLNSYWINLKNRHLEGANLSYTTLVKADLRSSVLDFSDLQGANLTQADLRNASLLHAYLIGTDLRMSDLRESKLNYSKLNNANLKDSKIEDAQIKNAYLINSTLDNTRLVRVNFQNSLLYNASFINACLKGANFANANLSHSNFQGADLSYVNFTNSDLRYTNLLSVKLYEAVPTGSSFTTQESENESRAITQCRSQECETNIQDRTAAFCKSKNMTGSMMLPILKKHICIQCPSVLGAKECPIF